MIDYFGDIGDLKILHEKVCHFHETFGIGIRQYTILGIINREIKVHPKDCFLCCSDNSKLMATISYIRLRRVFGFIAENKKETFDGWFNRAEFGVSKPSPNHIMTFLSRNKVFTRYSSCQWCGVDVEYIDKHHFPIKKYDGGEGTVSICKNCHFMYHVYDKSFSLPVDFISNFELEN